jgi:hypothetical protein
MTEGQNSHHDGNLDTKKFQNGATEFSVDAHVPLPEGYGDNRLVIMTRDPFWFFAYWEITHERAEQIRVVHGRDSWDQAALVLRVYDLGESQQTPVDSAAYFDVPADKAARQGYVQTPHAGHAYVADLGLRWPDGKFVSLFRSNSIRQPFGQISDQIDSQWMSVGLVSEQKAWETMALMAIGSGTSKGSSGTEETGNELALRWEFLRSVFSGSVSRWPSSWPSSKSWSGVHLNVEEPKR